MVTVEKVTEGFSITEGPHWDTVSQTLYFVDVYGYGIVKYNPSTNKTTKITFGNVPTFVIPIEGKTNHFVISQHNELLIISWDGVSGTASVIQKLYSLESTPDVPKGFNDAKCDSAGRLWIGTHSMDPSDVMKSQPLGALCSFDASKNQLTSHVGGIRLSNGLAFNDKSKKMFYIDSVIKTVDRFDFDVETGTVGNRETWFVLENHAIPGIPDGMTIDCDGNLWVAVFGGSCVLKIDGNKKDTLLETVKIPAEQVTSVAFGGKNLDELFVTSGNLEVGGKKPSLTANGAVFRVRGTGAKGLPATNFII